MAPGTTETPCGPAAVLAVCGRNGSGRTTLLENAIPSLIRLGLKVAVLRLPDHGSEAESPHEDIARLHHTGADVPSPDSVNAVDRRSEGSPTELAVRVTQLAADHDVVLVEGGNSIPLPKVWLVHPDDAGVPAEARDVIAVLPWDSQRPAAFCALIRQQLQTVLAGRPVYAGILVGGASKRMGRPKAMVSYQGRAFLDRIVDTVRGHVHRVCLLGKGAVPPIEPPPDQIPDAPDLSGPMAGIVAALRRAPQACWLIAACDLPRLQPAAIEWLLGRRAPGRWAVLPRLDPERVEPLLAIYEPQSLGLFEALTQRGVMTPWKIKTDPSVLTVDVPREFRVSWANTNTPEELNDLNAG